MGLWKLPDGLVLLGGAMLNKSLIFCQWAGLSSLPVI